MDENKHNHYPKVLARVETTTRRQQNITPYSEGYESFTKGTFTLSNAYPYIFDGLTFLCTNYATAKFKANGKIHDVIERRDNTIETHYRTVVRIDSFLDFTLDKHREYVQEFMKQLFQLAYKPPEKKRLQLTANRSIFTEPIRIDLITMDRAAEQGLKEYTPEERKKEKERLSNLKGCPQSEIEYVAIEFYKPLFNCLLASNARGTRGSAYIQSPKALHAKIKHTINRLENNGFFNGKDISAEKVPLCAMDARKIFLFLALHDNRKGEYININAVECALSCFPSCVKKNGKNENYISEKDGFDIRSKIKKTIVLFKQMGVQGKMDGGQFIPLELDETKVQYLHCEKKYNVKVFRPANPSFPIYSQKQLGYL
ncbi:hypothetical protein AGMMS49990_06770 [Endomicrobiia bacterium]|nr:hypothetical protein AGMMS49990_06770 [Endomicrobiia bacterium]